MQLLTFLSNASRINLLLFHAYVIPKTTPHISNHKDIYTVMVKFEKKYLFVVCCECLFFLIRNQSAFKLENGITDHA